MYSKWNFKLTALIAIIVAASFGLNNQIGAQTNNANDSVSSGNSNNSVSIDTIMTNALQAYGGKEHLSVFANNVQFTGEVSTQQDNGHKRIYRCVRKNNAWRADIEPDNEIIFDGKKYWQSGRKLGSKETQWFADHAQRQPFILAIWQNPDYHFELLGNTVYKQIPVYVVEIKDKGETATLVYLDRANFLVIAITFQSWQVDSNTGESKKLTVTREYLENRPALGGIWPYKEVDFIDNQAKAIYEVATVNSANNIGPDYFIPVVKSITSQSAPRQSVTNQPVTDQPVTDQSANANQANVVANTAEQPIDAVSANSASGAAPAASAPLVVPCEYFQRQLICRGSVEDVGPISFLINTGISKSLIERSLAIQCLLGRRKNARSLLEKGIMPLSKLTLGDLVINNPEVQIADLSSQSKQMGRSIAGIIGMDILSNYLVTIDYAKPSLAFADAKNGERPTNFISVPFVSLDQSSTIMPQIQATLPGADKQTILMDTGAAFNHLSASVAVKHLKDNLDKTGHTIEATGINGRPELLGLLTLDPVIVGSYKVHRVDFTYPVEETEKLKSLTSANSVDKNTDSNNILGNPFFEHFLVTIDCPSKKLLLKTNPQFETTYQMDQALISGDNALFTKRDFKQAEFAYQRAFVLANNAHDTRYQALAQGRLGNLRRMMAHDLHRPEHTQAAYNYFKNANELATKGDYKDAQGRILADWSLLYSENGQLPEAKQTIDKAILLAPKDAYVNIDYAVQLFRERMYAEAQKYIDKALFYDPSNWQALWYQVKLSEMFQDQKKEKTTLKEILQRYPWSKVAQNKLKALEEPSAKPSANNSNSDSHPNPDGSDLLNSLR